MILNSACIIAILIALAPLSLAQTEAPETAAGQTEEPAEGSSTAADSSNEKNIPSTSDSAGQTESSPYEYESTEQISEDRSVSFPVDI